MPYSTSTMPPISPNQILLLSRNHNQTRYPPPISHMPATKNRLTERTSSMISPPRSVNDMNFPCREIRLCVSYSLLLHDGFDFAPKNRHRNFPAAADHLDRKSTRLNSSHGYIS